MEGILDQIMDIILPILATALTGLFSWLALKLKDLYQEHVNTDEKEKVVTTTVKYVEQVFKDLDGEAKLQEALKQASAWLAEKKIPVTETELIILVEAAVNGLKHGTTDTSKISE